MSSKEMDRYQVLTKVRQPEMSQVDAARILGITDRQVRNLLTSLKSRGRGGLVTPRLAAAVTP